MPRLGHTSDHPVPVVYDVKLANLGDVAAIADAYVDAWRAGYEGLLEPAVLDREVQSREHFDWVHAIERSESTVFVAVDGARVVGVGESDDEPVTAEALPEVQMLYVRPSAWHSTPEWLRIRTGCSDSSTTDEISSRRG